MCVCEEEEEQQARELRRQQQLEEIAEREQRLREPSVRIVGKKYDGQQPEHEIPDILPPWALSLHDDMHGVPVGRQLEQLQEYLRLGVLNETEFRDAKQRVLQAPREQEMSRASSRDFVPALSLQPAFHGTLYSGAASLPVATSILPNVFAAIGGKRNQNEDWEEKDKQEGQEDQDVEEENERRDVEDGENNGTYYDAASIAELKTGSAVSEMPRNLHREEVENREDSPSNNTSATENRHSRPKGLPSVNVAHETEYHRRSNSFPESRTKAHQSSETSCAKERAPEISLGGEETSKSSVTTDIIVHEYGGEPNLAKHQSTSQIRSDRLEIS